MRFEIHHMRNYSEKVKQRIQHGAKVSAERSKEKKMLRELAFNKKCLLCETLIPYSKRRNNFCSKSCATSFNNRIHAKRCQEGVCKACEIKISSSRTYCKDCVSTHKWEETKKKIESNCGFLYEDRRNARRYLLEKFGNVCQICQTKEWFGQPVPLVCDHVDGNPDNNNLDNLRMVCANCNQLLPTFGIKNKGSGRAFRRKITLT